MVGILTSSQQRDSSVCAHLAAFNTTSRAHGLHSRWLQPDGVKRSALGRSSKQMGHVKEPEVVASTTAWA